MPSLSALALHSCNLSKTRIPLINRGGGGEGKFLGSRSSQGRQSSHQHYGYHCGTFREVKYTWLLLEKASFPFHFHGQLPIDFRDWSVD